MKAIFAGSFDPPTLGHLDIMVRSLLFCSELTVAVAVNPNKKSLFSDDEKVSLIEQSIQECFPSVASKIQVALCSSLLVDFAVAHNSSLIIRGVRNTVDFEYEYGLARINKDLETKIHTIFLPADEKLSIVSSSMVKELSKYHRDCSAYVTKCVQDALNNKFPK